MGLEWWGQLDPGCLLYNDVRTFPGYMEPMISTMRNLKPSGPMDPPNKANTCSIKSKCNRQREKDNNTIKKVSFDL